MPVWVFSEYSGFLEVRLISENVSLNGCLCLYVSLAVDWGPVQGVNKKKCFGELMHG